MAITDKDIMKRMSQILYSLALLTLLILSSCGKDTSMSTVSGTSSLNGGQCACNSSEMPVCGINPNGNAVTYPNMCTANCFGATNTVQGHCVCSRSLVCLSNGNSVSECEAQALIRANRDLTIVKFYGCNSKPPASL